MTEKRIVATMLASLVALTLTLAPPHVAAAPVRGVVHLPGALKSGRRFHGYWRIENGNVPVAPAALRGDTVVVLSGPAATAPAPKTTAVDIAGLQPSPPTVIIAEGSVLEIKNSDRMAHELSTPGQPSVMSVERLAPGATRKQRFPVAGGYIVRCTEHPHITISVIVTDSPFFAVADEKGAFKLPDAPEGKATLKVWSHGRWVHEAPIEIGAKTAELQIKVGEAAETQTGE